MHAMVCHDAWLCWLSPWRCRQLSSSTVCPAIRSAVAKAPTPLVTRTSATMSTNDTTTNKSGDGELPALEDRVLQAGVALEVPCRRLASVHNWAVNAMALSQDLRAGIQESKLFAGNAPWV